MMPIRYLLLYLVFGLLAVHQAFAEVPANALRHRAQLTREAHAFWGLDAPVATFAAQIHQESRWRENATSPVGAIGIAQFMPATASWIRDAYPSLRGDGATATNPAWSMRALVIYDKHLYDRIKAKDRCNGMWMTLWAYNGGLGWVYRDQAKATKAGANRLIATEVTPFNAGRTAAAFRENRGYPQVIIGKFEPLYIRSGFGQGVCHV